ncbi:MAG: site-specific integrase, partial [Gemmatimonadales bacterium]
GWEDAADAYAVLIDTGLRTGELFSLADTDVNLKGASLAIRATNAKSKKARGVPLTDRARGILKSRLGGGKPFGGFTEGSFRHKWDRLKGYMKLADDTGFVPHALRHTCASRLVQAGVELLVVKEWLGHSSIQVTMRYAHLAPKNLSAARDVLNRLNHEHAVDAAE